MGGIASSTWICRTHGFIPPGSFARRSRCWALRSTLQTEVLDVAMLVLKENGNDLQMVNVEIDLVV